MENLTVNVLPITARPIPDCDFDVPFRNAARGDFNYAWAEIDRHIVAATDGGRGAEADLFRSIAIIVSFVANFDSVSDPFQPRDRGVESRWPKPSDLTDADLVVVNELRKKSSYPPLRARLGDIFWIRRRREHSVAEETSADYIRAGTLFLTEDDWVYSVRWFQRGLQIGHQLGRKNESWLTAQTAALAAIDSPLAQTKPFFAAHFLAVFEKTGAGDPVSLANIAKQHVERAVSDGDYHRSRDYYELEAKFHGAAKEMEKRDAVRFASAKTYEPEADALVTRTPSNYLSASGILARGIEALRRVQADLSIIKPLKGKLSRYQKESLKELMAYSHEINLAPSVEQAAKIVENDDLREALKLLVVCHKLASVEEVRAQVIKNANDFPLSQMLGGSIVDSSGRVTGVLEPLIGSETDKAKAIESRMFRYAADYVWKFRAFGFIEPARQKIWTQHFPQEGDLEFLVTDNPFVPPGHEGIYVRGFHYGLCGDMLVAAHLLAPQIENSIRHTLQQCGVDVTNLESDLTQPVKTLGPLLDLPETKKIFGVDCVFELKGLLIEKMGYSFRHRVAHGFVSENDCYGPESRNIWWLALRMCYAPLLWAAAWEKQKEPHGPE